MPQNFMLCYCWKTKSILENLNLFIPDPRCIHLIQFQFVRSRILEPELSNTILRAPLFVRAHVQRTSFSHLKNEKSERWLKFKFPVPRSISIFPQKISRVVFQIAWVKFCWIDYELSKSSSAHCQPFTILQLPDRADSRPVSGSVRSRGYRRLRFQSAAS